MNKDDIIKYVLETPFNTNEAVLNSMLNTLIENESATAIEEAEAAKVIMPAQYITITDAEVEVTGVNISGLQNEEKLLFEVLVEDVYDEQPIFIIKYGDGEAHTTTNELVGNTEGGMYITIKKTNDVWKLKVTDGSSTYVPGSYIIKVVKSDILDAISVYSIDEG